MPADPIEIEDRNLVLGQRLREAIEELLHRGRVGFGQHQRERLVSADLGGGEQVGEREALVSETRRALAARPPDVADAALLADPGLILEPDRGALPWRSSAATIRLSLRGLVWGVFCQEGSPRVLSIFFVPSVSLFDLTARLFVPTHTCLLLARAQEQSTAGPPLGGPPKAWP